MSEQIKYRGLTPIEVFEGGDAIYKGSRTGESIYLFRTVGETKDVKLLTFIDFENELVEIRTAESEEHNITIIVDTSYTRGIFLPNLMQTIAVNKIIAEINNRNVQEIANIDDVTELLGLDAMILMQSMFKSEKEEA